MPRMNPPKSRERRTEYLQATFTPTERRLLEQLARSEDRTVSAVIRRGALALLKGAKP